ncbi:hypothetical protein ACIQGT_25745 [Streptomyces sp. NPDC093108]|jgi:DNA-binding IclR family transcriptional regulator|uniref:hypothetical protein n=1 Tax=Streptomyces sp. NPDC093108 TaxID=3366030 RepID=UPI00381FD2E2
MDINDHTPKQPRPGPKGQQQLTMLNTILRLGPGPHPFNSIVASSGLSGSEVHRRLRQLVDAGLCLKPRYGHYELRLHATAWDHGLGLLHPGATPPRQTIALLNELSRRTEQMVFLHTYSPLTRERVCVAVAGSKSQQFERSLAREPQAENTLRQAPLDEDAPGLILLAHICDTHSPLSNTLQRIRQAGVAVSRSPLHGWSWTSVPVQRLPGSAPLRGAEPRVTAAVSVLAPETSSGAHVVAYHHLLRRLAAPADQEPATPRQTDLTIAASAA